VVGTTPGVPRERVAFLESALKKTAEDPECQKRFDSMGTPVDYAPGKVVLGDVNEMLSLSGEEKALIGSFMGAKGY